MSRLLHELNTNTRIQVKTPVGISEKREIGEIWGQGTIESAIVSSNNLDAGVGDFFQTSDFEFFFGSLRLQPLLYQDDLLRACSDPVSAQHGIDRLQNLAETKLLDYNWSKCSHIFMGKRNARNKLEESFVKQPPFLYDKDM